jgi:Mn2+/Fe2+ NRAMP family transporter
VPVPAVDQPDEIPQRVVKSLQPGLQLNVRGRSIQVRRLRQAPTGPLAVLAILGPGLIAAMAGDDAGGIATYSSVGAKYGYDLLWMMLLITVGLALVQEMAARLGAATGRGLLDLIRERFGIGWALVSVGVVLIANGGVIVTEFVGIGAAVELFGGSRYWAVPLSAVILWRLVIGGNYGQVEKIFIAMTLVFFAYPVAAFLAGPDWGAVARGTFLPTIHRDPDYLLLFVGTVGTTITPYMQLFQQSANVEKGIARRHYGPERMDAYAGAVLSNLIAAFIIIASAATLHVAGITEIETAADAAQALRPVAGDFATVLFAVGLLGASLLAAGVLPLATAYSVSEAFGFRKGVSLDFRRAPIFLRLFSVLMAMGALIALIPNIPIIQLLVVIQVLNGLLLPVILVFMLLLINDVRLVGSLKNGRLMNVLGWSTFAFVSAAVVTLLGAQLLTALGFGS